MIDHIRFLGRANAVVNQKMLDVVMPLTDEVLTKNRDSYFGSMKGVLTHILLSDLVWLSRFRDMPQRPQVLQTSEVDPMGFDHTADHWSNMTAYRLKREAVDRLIVSWTTSLDINLMAADLDYRNSRGAYVSLKAWQAVIHMFNHQTHHRGQVSLMLDQAGVENDYSNLHTLL